MAGERMRRVNEAVREVVSAHLAEDVGEILRRKNRIHQFVQRFAIFGHAERGCEPDHALS